MSADLILYALIAVVLVFWLRNTLGTRHGEERQRDNPLNSIDLSAPKKPDPFARPQRDNTTDRGQVIDINDFTDTNPVFDLKRFPGLDIRPDAAPGLMDIMKYDRMFDPYKFIQGAKDAFPIILESFADGDTDTLQELLSPAIYKSFIDVIDARKIRGETMKTEIHAVRKLDIIEARMVGRMAYITVRITADETCVIRNAENHIISGNPDRVTELTDVWTFGRNTADRDPTWLVCETRDDVVEADSKTPIPDADGRI